jgi:hypothetical protein
MLETTENAREVGRIQSAAAVAAAAPGVTCNIVNQTAFTARIVIMAHRNHDLQESRALVPSNRNVSTSCPRGEVVFVVFDADDDSFYEGSVLDVSGTFSYLIT